MNSWLSEFINRWILVQSEFINRWILVQSGFVKRRFLTVQSEFINRWILVQSGFVKRRILTVQSEFINRWILFQSEFIGSFPEWIYWDISKEFTLSFFCVKITHGLTDLNRYNENWDLPCFFSLGTRDLGSQKERERYWDAGQTTGCVMGFGNILAGKWDLNVLLIVHPLLTDFTEIVSRFLYSVTLLQHFFLLGPAT